MLKSVFRFLADRLWRHGTANVPSILRITNLRLYSDIPFNIKPLSQRIFDDLFGKQRSLDWSRKRPRLKDLFSLDLYWRFCVDRFCFRQRIRPDTFHLDEPPLKVVSLFVGDTDPPSGFRLFKLKSLSLLLVLAKQLLCKLAVMSLHPHLIDLLLTDTVLPHYLGTKRSQLQVLFHIFA
jgi:hypothetical protein